jgi:hypothetical protein
MPLRRRCAVAWLKIRPQRIELTHPSAPSLTPRSSPQAHTDHLADVLGPDALDKLQQNTGMPRDNCWNSWRPKCQKLMMSFAGPDQQVLPAARHRPRLVSPASCVGMSSSHGGDSAQSAGFQLGQSNAWPKLRSSIRRRSARENVEGPRQSDPGAGDG